MPGSVFARLSTLPSTTSILPSTRSNRSDTVLKRSSDLASKDSKSLWTPCTCRVRKANDPSISLTRRCSSRISASTFIAMPAPYHFLIAAVILSLLRRLARPALPPLPGRLRQHWREKLPRIAPRRLDDVLGRAPGDDFAAAVAA